MIKYIIFDLSEVIIRGIIGIETVLCRKLSIPENTVINCFCGQIFEELMIGNLAEDDYLETVIKRQGWNIHPAEIKEIIRQNFHTEVEGVIPIVRELSEKYKLYLLSDHSKEWVEYIKQVHPFLKIFDKVFFSFEFKMTKRNPAVFKKILEELSVSPEECLFIDDHQRNIDNARLAGIEGICFKNAIQLREELSAKLPEYSKNER